MSHSSTILYRCDHCGHLQNDEQRLEHWLHVSVGSVLPYGLLDTSAERDYCPTCAAGVRAALALEAKP